MLVTQQVPDQPRGDLGLGMGHMDNGSQRDRLSPRIRMTLRCIGVNRILTVFLLSTWLPLAGRLT